LAAVALALAFSTTSAGAAQNVAGGAADPSAVAATDSVVYERVGGSGVLRRGGLEIPLPGTDPAIGGSYIAVLDGQVVRLLSSATLAPVATVEAPNADALAVSDAWLVYRARLGNGGDGIFARSIVNPAVPGPFISLDSIADPAQLSPPSLDGDVLVYAVARPNGSRIVQRVMSSGESRTLVKSGRSVLFNPAVQGDAFVYTQSQGGGGKLVIRTRGRRGRGHNVFGLKRAQGIVWSTALTELAAYVTVLHPGSAGAAAELVEVPLGEARPDKKKRKKKKRRRRR
ncbi:MAG: hypothetical protein ACRDL6_01365, partial [Solirubrobacterales bacterium]